ncbi:MAG: 16S rRNA methyltransferase [Anaerolineae bacterium]
MLTEAQLDALVTEIRRAPKYREMPMTDEVIRDVIQQESQHQSGTKAILKAAKKKLHNIAALYLGDPDYDAMTAALSAAQGEDFKRLCLDIAAVHTSTQERLRILDTFYPRIFEVTGRPNTVLDLACALNPFLLPWMGLPLDVRYHAYDIHPPRVALVNHAFRLMGVEPLAEVRDILVHPPEQPADVALILKEVHRFEQRRKGITRPMLEALNARYIVVSLPVQSMSGRSDLKTSYSNLFYNIIKGTNWPVTELEFSNELVFCINRTGD